MKWLKAWRIQQSSFSNPSVVSPTSQFILQHFFCFSYITSSSLNSPGELPYHHFIFTLLKWRSVCLVCIVFNVRVVSKGAPAFSLFSSGDSLHFLVWPKKYYVIPSLIPSPDRSWLYKVRKVIFSVLLLLQFQQDGRILRRKTLDEKKMLLLGFTTLLKILGHQRRFRHRAWKVRQILLRVSNFGMKFFYVP